jgi:polar amino acid transport system substrate-binding protein
MPMLPSAADPVADKEVKLGSPGETLKNKLADKLKAERGVPFKDVKAYDDHSAAYLALAQGSVAMR